MWTCKHREKGGTSLFLSIQDLLKRQGNKTSCITRGAMRASLQWTLELWVLPLKKSEIRHDKMQSCIINTMAYTLMLGGVGFEEKVRLEIQMADIYYHLWPTLGYYRRKQEESNTFFLINLFTSGESWCNYKCPNAVISFVYSFSSLFCLDFSRTVLKILTILQLLALSHRS